MLSNYDRWKLRTPEEDATRRPAQEDEAPEDEDADG